ncbi:PQQ-binding-like beta-propeller repeat protein [Candidatus Poribacteria bacterium]
MSILGLLLIANFGFSLRFFTGSGSNDWPMWRYDANRSAASPHKLSDKLHLQWVRDYPQLTQAWKSPRNRDLMRFDKVYEPVVLGKTMFVGSSASDRMVALDTETGEERWSFYVGGPVRLPPVAHNGKVYFISDDGYLYCVDAQQGTLIWKFRGGPSGRKILGNERIVSTWSARGGPVLKDGIIYFGAGIWPFMGVFIYAIDAETGEIVWENDSTGPIYIDQPHNKPAYAGVAPQGAFVISGDRLLVPGGRSAPACFDRQTGELLYYHLAKYSKGSGAFVAAQGDYFVNYYRDDRMSLYDLSKGHKIISGFGNIPVMTEKTLFTKGDSITAFDIDNLRQAEKEERFVVDAGKKRVKIAKDKEWVLDSLWSSEVDASGDLIKAGRRLYAGGKNIVSAVSIPRFGTKTKVKWKANIQGTASRIIAADNKLFVVTLEGRIYAFGKKKVEPAFYSSIPEKSTITDHVLAEAEYILETTGVKEGYCLAYGLENGDLVEALAEKSELRIIAVDPDQEKVDRLRKKFDAVGLYGKRLSVHVGDPFTFEAPPYVASLTVFENLKAAGYNGGDDLFRRIYNSIRPYGGIACLPVSGDGMPTVAQQIQAMDLTKAKIRKVRRVTESLQSEDYILLIRQGPLPGASDWTHQYGDIANTVKSDDELVKAPLGILWFGGSSNMDVLPRHAHGPPEQVIGGRLYIEGVDSISARDVYTGRVLWKTMLSDLNTLGIYHDEPDGPNHATSQDHIPGANARGTNFVATLGKIYVAKKNSCVLLDSVTGEIVDEIRLPPDPATGMIPEWGYIGVYEDYLIAGAGFARYSDFIEIDEYEQSIDSIRFSADAEAQSDLNNRVISAALRQRFSDKKKGLSSSASVSVKKPDARWLITSSNKRYIVKKQDGKLNVYESKDLRFYDFDATSSRKLIVMDRHTGEVLWSRDSKLGFRHSAIAVGDDKIFCIDKLPPMIANTLRRRAGEYRFDPPMLMALDLRTGNVIWSTSEIILGTWLGYSEERDILLQARISEGSDMLKGESPQGMSAYRGKDGELLWSESISHRGMCILHNDKIINSKYSYSLLTGEQETRIDPLTGEQVTWSFLRNYGCNQIIASEHLLTFRSTAAGFFDLANDGGTGNFGGFKSSCTSNLVVANGVLNAPDYTRTCSCSYQNQTSLALVHLPEVEIWTDNTLEREQSAIKASTNAITFFDAAENLTYANSSFLKMLGYDKDSEILGDPISKFLQEGAASQKAKAALYDKGEWTGELTAVKNDGSTLDVYLSANLSIDAKGASISTMVLLVDVTTSAAALFDLEGNLMYVNGSLLELLGYDDDTELLGRSVMEIWQTRKEAAEVLAALRSEGEWKGELAAVKEDGSTVDIYLSASMASDETGVPVAMTASFIDVTERESLKSAVDGLDSALRSSRNIRQVITDSEPIRFVGINLGAPGDRKADDGTLWLEYPVVGGPSPEVPVTIDSDKLLFNVFDTSFQATLDDGDIPQGLNREFKNRNISLPPYATVSVEEKGSKWLIVASRQRTYIVEKSGYWLNIYGYERFFHHSSRIQGEGLRWVVASGIKGVSTVTIALARKPAVANAGDDKDELIEAFIKRRPYTVRLYFSEPDDVKPGQRSFDVAIQGQEKLRDFDIVKEAGGKNRPIVKEFKSIPVTWDLALTFTPSESATGEPLICGVEVIPEGW